jgi:hypothetical protein
LIFNDESINKISQKKKSLFRLIKAGTDRLKGNRKLCRVLTGILTSAKADRDLLIYCSSPSVAIGYNRKTAPVSLSVAPMTIRTTS